MEKDLSLHVVVFEERDIFQELLLRCMTKVGVQEEQIHFLGSEFVTSANVQLQGHVLCHQTNLLQPVSLLVFFGQQCWDEAQFRCLKSKAETALHDFQPFLVTYGPSISTSSVVAPSERLIPELFNEVDILGCILQALSQSRQSLQSCSRVSTSAPAPLEDIASSNMLTCDESRGDDETFSSSSVMFTETCASEDKVIIVLLESSPIFQAISLPRFSTFADVHLVDDFAQALDKLMSLQSFESILIFCIGEVMSHSNPKLLQQHLISQLNVCREDGFLSSFPFLVNLSHTVDTVSLDTEGFHLTMPSYVSETDVSICLNQARVWNKCKHIETQNVAANV
jgi:hypothetical protein